MPEVILPSLVLIFWSSFIAISLFLFSKSSLNLGINSFSFLGKTRPYGPYFNFALSAIGIFQLLFLFIMLYRTPHTPTLLFFFITSTVCGVLAGIINLNRSEALHNIVSLFGVLSGSTGYIILGIQLIPESLVTALFLIALTCVLIVALPYFFLKIKDTPAIVELIFFFNALISSLILTTRLN